MFWFDDIFFTEIVQKNQVNYYGENNMIDGKYVRLMRMFCRLNNIYAIKNKMKYSCFDKVNVYNSSPIITIKEIITTL